MSEGDIAIITHSGIFHLDEVMATALLRKLGHYGKNVIRTRDPKIIEVMSEGGALIIDVGGKDDPSLRRFDHHQSGFERCFNDRAASLGIKMSSLGLVYQEYGMQLFADTKLENIDELYNKFYEQFIMEIDAGDNGVSELKSGIKHDDVFKFARRWHLSGAIRQLNNIKVADTGPLADEQDKQFEVAVGICRTVLDGAVDHFIAKEKDYVYSKKLIEKSGEMKIIGNGMLAIIPEKCEYHRAMQDYERDAGSGIKWLFTVLPREDGKNNPEKDEWQIHTVNITGEAFKNKADIVDKEKAKRKIGDDLKFVHNNRFIAVTKNRNSAVKLALASLNDHDKMLTEKKTFAFIKYALLIVVLGFFIGMIIEIRLK
jgi:uncharacterized UPF0160 family protein